MSQKNLQLNIKESSIRKKRGISFFADNKKNENEIFDYDRMETQGDIATLIDHSKMRRNDVGLEPGTSNQIQSAAKILKSIHSMKNSKQVPVAPSPASAFSNMGIHKYEKSSTEKEIVSAMVRMNTQGLNVPCNFDELKKLPVIPQTSIMKKKWKSDVGGLKNNFCSLDEANEEDELRDEDSDDELINKSTVHKFQSINNSVGDEDTTTVFDLVHRGRQRAEHFKQLQKQASGMVLSPKIISPANVNERFNSINRIKYSLQDAVKNQKLLKNASQQSFLLGRKDLQKQYKSVGNSRERHTHATLHDKNRKAIKNFNQEVHSAMLPQICGSVPQFKNFGFETNQSHKNISINEYEDEKDKKIYIHEETYDPNTNSKWTVFNKHEIQIDNSSNQQKDMLILEDQIIQQMKLDAKLSQEYVCNIHENSWIQLYEAKCIDLGIPYKADKQQERFITQMQLNQRDDKICLKDQSMGFNSAIVISKLLLQDNENLVKIDLSNNQFQQNFHQIVKGIVKNKRIISLIMRNNQLNGLNDSQEIKKIVKNHYSLSNIDFSNNELNVNKNKLRNQGVSAIVDGILESTEMGYSLISEINLSYNYLTYECLTIFAKLSNPDWIQLQNLNLSYNDLGPDSIKNLAPILSSIEILNLSHTKLNNQSMEDLSQIYKQQEMRLKDLQIHSNQITTDGLFKLMLCLKTNNKVRRLNISKNMISQDIKLFKMVSKFLNCNKILEDLDMSFCQIDRQAGSLIGKGLRGNRNLQTLSLKGNPLKNSIQDIAKAFDINKKALSIKNLDLSKCQIECEHITHEFTDMIKSEFTTLKVLNLRDNYIKWQSAERVKDALKLNKTITKVYLDYNPIKKHIIQQIESLCKRNQMLDEINQKNKNLSEFMSKKKKVSTQKQALNSEIGELKNKTDITIDEAQSSLNYIEKLQLQRKSAQDIIIKSAMQPSCLNSQILPSNMMTGLNSTDNSYFGNIMNIQEPKTSLTKGSHFTFNSQSSHSFVQHSRHKSQGPMRSEKVYLMTQLIEQKIDQLTREKVTIKESYKDMDQKNTDLKELIREQHQKLQDELLEAKQQLNQRDEQIEQLQLQEKEIKQKYDKMIEDMLSHIQVVKLGQDHVSKQIKAAKIDLAVEKKKYDRFLARDREKLGYVQDMMKTREMVKQSYESEIQRQNKIKDEMKKKQAEINEQMAIAINDKMANKKEEPEKKKASSKPRPQLQKTKSRAPYDNVKSKLFQSIQASRSKEQPKFVNVEKQKTMLYKKEKNSVQAKENMSNFDRFQSHSKYTAKSPVSENKSFMTGQKHQKSALRHIAITDRKKENSGLQPFSQNKNASNINSNGRNNGMQRKIVVFKQQSMKQTESVNESGFHNFNDQESVVEESAAQDCMQMNCMGSGIGGFIQQNINSAFDEENKSKENDMKQSAIQKETLQQI